MQMQLSFRSGKHALEMQGLQTPLLVPRMLVQQVAAIGYEWHRQNLVTRPQKKLFAFCVGRSI